MDNTLRSERWALRIACCADKVNLHFRHGHQRDALKQSEAVNVETTFLFRPGGGPTVCNTGWDAQDTGPKSREWPYIIGFTHNMRTVPRFGVTEAEGTWDGEILTIDVPPLDRLPWPQCRGQSAAEQHQRTAAERLLWAKLTGYVTTQMQAAAYLREHAPKAAMEVLRPVWSQLLTGLALPKG